MPIEVTPSAEELDELHDDLKSYEAKLAAYLSSDASQNDPNYTSLAKTDIQLNLQIYNLSTAQLQLAGANAGAAVDAINSAVGNLKATFETKSMIEKDLDIAQSAVAFVVALLTQNPSAIVSTGGEFVNRLKAA